MDNENNLDTWLHLHLSSYMSRMFILVLSSCNPHKSSLSLIAVPNNQYLFFSLFFHPESLTFHLVWYFCTQCNSSVLVRYSLSSMCQKIPLSFHFWMTFLLCIEIQFGHYFFSTFKKYQWVIFWYPLFLLKVSKLLLLFFWRLSLILSYCL